MAENVVEIAHSRDVSPSRYNGRMTSARKQKIVAEFTARVRDYAQAEALWQDGDRLLVAVSGGPDSVALLDVLYALKLPWLAVAHVHHGLRAEADADAALVEEMAARAGLPFVSVRVDVLARMATTGESLETAARELRYTALRRLARDLRATRIVTGHTADDQAETVLMRLLRGTGVTGLAGIPPRRGEIVRPLLAVRREEILAYLRARELSYCHDASNDSLDMTRNRLRLELLPLLERDYAPGVGARLEQLAVMARRDNAALDGWAAAEFARLRRPWPDGIALPIESELPPGLLRRLWRLALMAVRGSLEDIGFAHLEEIAALPSGQQLHLPGARVVREAGSLVFLPAPEETDPEREIALQPLPVPGQLCLAEIGCCVRAEACPGAAAIEGGDVAVLDAAAVAGPLTVRGWQAGDRFRPLGAPGTRALQDIFVDAGVPRRLRRRVPVIFDREGIVWLAGFRLADRVKMNGETARSVRLSVEWEWNPWTLQLSPHR